MRKMACVATMVVWVLSVCETAEAVSIVVSADAMVAGGFFSGENFSDETFGGGLLTGRDGSDLAGPYRFYLMFTLPVFAPNTFVQSAILQGFYSDDWDVFDDRTHSFYQAPNTWTESTITWNNQPGSIGGPLGVFNANQATPGTFQSWDITPAFNRAYLEQSLLFGLMLRADDEALGLAPVFNHNLEYFASREFMGGTRAFRIDVEMVPDPGSTLLLFGIGLVGVMRLRLRSRC